MKQTPTALALRITILALLPTPTAASEATACWAIVVPTQGAAPRTASQAIARLSRRSEVLEQRPLFDRGESAALVSLGNPGLARATRIKLASSEAIAQLSRWAVSQSLPVSIEPAQSEFGLEADAPVPRQVAAPGSLQDLQWGLRNFGQSARLDIDDLTSVEVRGKPGEDIGLDRIPQEPVVLNPRERIRVAVLDSGIDTSHPDLRGQIVTRPSECAKLDEYRACLRSRDAQSCDAEFLTQDTDGNGYPLDCHGWNVATQTSNRASGIWGDPDPRDDAGHGTHVAGIIGAALAPVTGTRGVAPDVEILPVKVIATAPLSPVRPQSEGPAPGAEPSSLPEAPAPNERSLRWTAGFTDLVARGLLYAIRSGARVANLSMAWPQGADSTLMRQMVQLAQARGMIVVASAGNDSTDSRVMPCQYPGVICVASHGPDGALSHFSNHGAFVDIAAPGLSILSTWPMGKRQGRFFAYDGYEIKNGTSMSAPFVTGSVARMLSMGLSPREIYARLLTGARPSQPSGSKWTRSGNLDLAAALSAEARPLILPVEKSVIKLDWDGKASEIPLSLKLRNYWSAGQGISLSARILSESGATSGAQLSIDHWDALRLEEDATIELTSSLQITSPSVEGRLSIELTVSDEAARTRTFRQPLEIAMPVAPGQPPEGSQILPLLGPDGTRIALPRGTSLRSVTALDGRPAQDYLAVQARPGGAILYLLLEQPDLSYRVVIRDGFAVPQGGELLQIQRLASDDEAHSERVLIYRLPPQADKPSAFRFLFVNAAAEVTRQLDYANEISAIPERFQWIRTASRERPYELVPAWISLGLTPPLEKPAFDPWHPRPVDKPAFRIYYLGSEGLRSIPTGEFTPVDLLAPTRGQRMRGEVPALLAKGEGWTQSYSTAVLAEGAYSQVRPFTLPRYRMLIGLQDRSEVTPLTRDPQTPGMLYAGAGASGGMRGTALLSNGEVLDFTQEAPSLTSSLIHSVGLFTGTRAAAVSQSQYDLIFTDIASGESRSTSLDRFSFLPSAITRRSFVPAVAERASEQDAQRIPAILIPGSLGATQATEVITPAYAPSGALEALVRPARLRLSAKTGCDALANPVPATADSPTRVAFFCGDHLIRVPLIQP